MTTVNVSISDELRAFVEAQVSKRGLRGVSEYLEHLLREAQQREGHAQPRSASTGGNGSDRPPWEVALAIGARVPADEWAKVPSDLSKNLDHYLYNAPREE
jgi:Arc/MetJ-type ribon-helix-helix transcriptional regulator